MSGATDLACPACGTELDLAVVFESADDHAAFDRLTANATPLRTRATQYLALFKPPKQRLNLRKKAAILLRLLPDLERGVIAWKGREISAPPAAWAQAIDQVLARRDAGTLELPMKNHGYLYAVLAGIADKAEASAEASREAAKRHGPDTVQVRGQTLPIGQALQVAYAGKDPALAKLDADRAAAAPMPDAVRERLQALRAAPTNPKT